MPPEGRKQGRGDLSDAQWKLIAPLLPKQRRGGKWNDHRLMFDGILWVLRTGAPWRDLPERYGKWGSVYHRFNRWRNDGTSHSGATRSSVRAVCGWTDARTRSVLVSSSASAGSRRTAASAPATTNSPPASSPSSTSQSSADTSASWTRMIRQTEPRSWM